ncbi:mechanosensitive ion channel family protein [Rhizobium calliandrae]|uniref:Small-conductance mechanosensitive channel n=1 Tax=Rhizobium calliandrae TaxID=1312182 RepID=A0ABT7KGL1_9HYPH|nr:mechanosensitive ion channel family protein [Rhizobium calliandrae]MDL2407755.1 mechanosensitive ion channel family protein [Rhizobium calliandrae]
MLLPNGSLCRFLLNIALFAALTALLLYHGIPPYVAKDVDPGVAAFVTDDVLKTLWWVGGAMVLVSSVRMFLILELKPREGRLLQDLVIALIYVGAAFCISAYVFRLPVGTVIATSGVFAIALGLALQSTLNDVFSGIALNLNRPLSVGDWVVLDETTQGRVVETNWRSTQFLNATGDLVVVPNSVLAKSKITNLSIPNASHGASFRVKLLPTAHPAKILEVMEKVLLSSNEILRTPSASAAITAMDRDAVEIELSFRVTDIARVASARNELFDLVYRHSQAAGLRLATSSPSDPDDKLKPTEPAQHLKRFMDLFSLFDGFTDQEKIDLASNMNRLVFKQGEVIAHKGSTLTSLMLLKSGVAGFFLEDGKSKIEFGRIAPGDLFGERGVLLGMLQVCDVRAISPVIICEIPKARIAAMLHERPAIAEELALLLSARTKAEEAAHKNGIAQPSHNMSTLRSRIRHLFHLP